MSSCSSMRTLPDRNWPGKYSKDVLSKRMRNFNSFLGILFSHRVTARHTTNTADAGRCCCSGGLALPYSEPLSLSVGRGGPPRPRSTQHHFVYIPTWSPPFFERALHRETRWMENYVIDPAASANVFTLKARSSKSCQSLNYGSTMKD